MRRCCYVATCITAFIFAGCSSSVSVSSDYDPANDFSNLKWFRWFGTPKRDAGDPLTNQLLETRVKLAVEKAMTAKGFVRLDRGEPDFFVAAHGGTKEKMNVTDWGYAYGPYWGGMGYGQNIDVNYYTEASLVIDVVRTAKPVGLVWRGVGTGVTSRTQRTPEEIQERLDDAVAQILADFPPGARGR